MKVKHLLAATVCVTIGCLSTPKISYYTLAMTRSGNVSPTVNLDVEAVRTTDALSRSKIMVQASPTEVEYFATDQWVGDLAELVKEKLAVEFGDAAPGRETVALSILVLGCGQVDTPGGAEGRMRLSVTFRDPAAKRFHDPLLEKVYEATHPASKPTAGAVVEALSRCAEDLAARIAEDASQL